MSTCLTTNKYAGGELLMSTGIVVGIAGMPTTLLFESLCKTWGMSAMTVADAVVFKPVSCPRNETQKLEESRKPRKWVGRKVSRPRDEVTHVSINWCRMQAAGCRLQAGQ